MFNRLLRRAVNPVKLNKPRQNFLARRFFSDSGPIIGIDLGTTNSCVSVMEGDKPIVLEVDGKRTLPSIFAVDKDGNRFVGLQAQRQMVVNPRNTFFATKRLIGRRYDDKQIQNIAKDVPYKIVPSPNGDAWVQDEFGRSYSPSEVASNILLKLREVAENHLGCPVNRAVITVPAYFDNHQRQATEDAGKIAGLKVERIINEPTAAALAYGISRDEEKVVAVYDLGGGTFDISVLELGNGVFEVKSTSGDTFLGGEDFNSLLVKYIINDFQKKKGIDLSKDKVALQRVREAAELAKHDLSTVDVVNISLPFIRVDASGKPMSLEMEINRAKFEELADELIRKSIDPCKIALKDAGLNVADVTDVILVGGMTRMPKVRQVVKQFFKKEPFAGVNPDEAVAQGAALQAGIISNKGLMPGAEEREIILLDVTPLNLGISVHTGAMSVIIPAQTSIPCTATESYTTVQDYQTSITTEVYQGNRPIAKDNRLLGSYVVNGILPAPAGVPKIDVTFECSANGTIKVTSKDRGSGKEYGITINMSGGLSDAEINKMKIDAEKNREKDKQRVQIVKTQENARSFINKIETGLSQIKASDTDVKTVKDAIQKLQNTLNSSSIEEIEKLVKELETVSNRVFKAAYESSSKK
eukprot:TRINITY_DN2860_c0_g1_i1.p1 TRINITY_DN2860_c0_g1~~TRINITY_DN2860_c0_g1_i1.p1  ORF type:complete len:641 (+),score=159.81 TRINITY_DN2860_c0_g1_i1:59-1981(+)